MGWARLATPTSKVICRPGEMDNRHQKVYAGGIVLNIPFWNLVPVLKPRTDVLLEPMRNPLFDL